MAQIVNLYEELKADRPGAPPLVLKVVTQRHGDHIAGGVSSSSVKMEEYVMFSVLPDELKERVRTALHALAAQM